MDKSLELNIQSLDYFKAYFSRLKNKNKLFSSLGTTFKTQDKYYFYDAGTGKVFDINDRIYTVLVFLFEKNDLNDIDDLDMSLEDIIITFDEIKESIEYNKVLSAPPMTIKNMGLDKNLENIYKNGINSMLLEVTQKCNLRCKYCIYHEDYDGYRDFGKADMDWQTAKESIDFLISHSNKDENIHIGFYGGEPLIKFDLIKQCVEYAYEKIERNRLSFSMTTNGTLITEEISDYLTNLNKIYITISLDGPKDIHDSYRIYPNDKGSFNDTIRGIEYIVNHCNSKRIDPQLVLSINTVVDFPETQEKFNSIQRFFGDNNVIPLSIPKNYSYASHGIEEVDYTLPNSKEELLCMEHLYDNHSSITEWTIDLLKQNANGLENSELFSYSDLNEMLVIVHHRAISNDVISSYRLNSCCIPGARRLYVEVNGDLLPCERVGYAPKLGNINRGLDIQRIKKDYLQDFGAKASIHCNDCWATNACGVCYMDSFDENGVNMNSRHRHCQSYRYNLRLALSVYHEILEKNPKSLKFLNDIVFN